MRGFRVSRSQWPDSENQKTMNERYLVTSRTPSAFYDPELLCWKTCQESWIPADPALLRRLPACGMTAAGALFALPTWEPPTNERAGFVSLPTPVVNDMGADKTIQWWDDWTEKIGGHGDSLSIQMRRLPTPTTVDSHSTGRTQESLENGNTKNLTLREAVKMRRLKTPTASKNGRGRPQGYTHRTQPGGRFDLVDQLAALESTNQPLEDGSKSLDGQHLTQLTIMDFSTLDSLSG